MIFLSYPFSLFDKTFQLTSHFINTNLTISSHNIIYTKNKMKHLWYRFNFRHYILCIAKKRIYVAKKEKVVANTRKLYLIRIFIAN